MDTSETNKAISSAGPEPASAHGVSFGEAVRTWARIAILSWMYAAFGQVGPMQAAFFSLKAAVLAVVLEAVIRMGRRSLKSTALIAMKAIAFIAIFFFSVPFPLLVVAAAAFGFFMSRVR